MSKENFSYDVRIALYEGTNGNFSNITFFNNTETLLECERVKIIRDCDKLYFHTSDVSGGIKFSGNKSKITGEVSRRNMLQLWTDYTKVSDMEGYYDLKYDTSSDLYYIDKSDKISEHTHKYSVKGRQQLDHSPNSKGKVLSEEERNMTAILTDRAKKMATKTKEESKKDMSKTAATYVVVKALVNLLKTQLADNEEALITVETLEKYI